MTSLPSLSAMLAAFQLASVPLMPRGDADAGALQCRGVVDLVAGHRQRIAAGLKGLYDARLELGCIASIREIRPAPD